MTSEWTPEQIKIYRRNFQARMQRQRERREIQRQRALAIVRATLPMLMTEWPAVHRAYLFGSITREGAFHAKSDIDIAIEGEINAETYFALWHALERTLPDWAIDLRDISTHSRFADLVRQYGELIYEQEDTIAASGDSGGYRGH
jgi:predicted nucleotidyltransferase